ncbi:MAG: cytidine deaminase [Lentimicrobiaceae bacterium]|jgi:cytidine deaminase|nr:cytidine deaminase [Lentimicrobiaceae bacterium]MCP4909246.1 cytidine deaminase [Bacteroidota bacterium]MBT3454208.1 cytidine deaminase [Lentimicrobiaceae bacterium]MBT3819233.1 cytidine deaminase [Lentimicrobiaceae bacterium]MBT4060368.1 cytidine deaminase [Lentimicrobiaceae bacterium]
MKEKEVVIKYGEYQNKEDLGVEDSKLVLSANEATNNSYAPYSDFKVGAAILLDNGEIIKGTNQENSAYPSGLCAERVAIFFANSQFPDAVIKSIAIASQTDRFESDEPISPCGSCRQVISEAENRQKSKIRVIMSGNKCVTRIVEGIENLLPFGFQEDKLKKTCR